MDFGIIFTTTQVYLLGLSGSLMLVLIGFYVTDTLNRKKDMRSAAEELFIRLNREKGCICVGNGISRTEFDVFSRKLPYWSRKSFMRCVETYYKTKRENRQREAKNDFHGGTPAIIDAIDELLKFTK